MTDRMPGGRTREQLAAAGWPEAAIQAAEVGREITMDDWFGPEPEIDREAFLAAGRNPDPEAEAAEAEEAAADAETGYWQALADAGLFDPEAGQ